MPTHAATLSVRSSGKGTYEITRQIEDIIAEAGITTGTATVFVQHTSASLVIMENADPSARTDLHAFFDHLVPEDTPYFVHTYEGPDDMPSRSRESIHLEPSPRFGASEVDSDVQKEKAPAKCQASYDH